MCLGITYEISLDQVRVWCFIVPYGPSVETHQKSRTSMFSRPQIGLSNCSLSDDLSSAKQVSLNYTFFSKIVCTTAYLVWKNMKLGL